MIDKTVRDFLHSRHGRLAIAFLVAACAFGIVVHLAPWRRSFDSQAWRDEELVRAGERREMADDLIARRMLDGLNRAEVVSLLGESLPPSYFPDWDLVYRLGNERGYGLWFVVRFGSDGRVKEYRIVTN
jgi:hypothetical protein